ncbi:MAG: radical SAM protein [Deltaproteobacteria bacterium]|nr:radical SAM protein [Deltaproteobacteria bacterium]
MEASYVTAWRTGRLKAAVRAAYRRLAACDLCPRRCGVNRLRGERGVCRTGLHAKVASAGPHFGEERPLVGHGGSGTVFFAECNLRCRFCQNWDISQQGEGSETPVHRLARIFLWIQGRGCHNLNLVTPSHVVPQILAALGLAAARGLRIPVVYNTGAYDAKATLELLDGVVDVYMPDLKWTDPEVGARLADAPDYWEVAREAVAEMHRQVGDLEIDDRGLAVRGLLVRHLVLPGGLAGTREVMAFLAERISPRTYVNVMGQYRPVGEAHALPPLDRRVSRAEVAEAVRIARAAGITHLDR